MGKIFFWNWRSLKNGKLINGCYLLLIITILRKTVYNRVREMDAFNQVDGNASIAIMATLIMGTIVLSHWKELKNSVRYCTPFFYYYLFAALSIIWAGIDNIMISGYKAAEVLASFLIVMLIMQRLQNNRARFNLIIISMALFDIMFFLYARGHNNAYPLLAVTHLLLALGAIKCNLFGWKKMWPHIILAMSVIVLATSTASWLSLIIGLFFYYCTTKKGINLGVAIVVAVAFYVVWMMFSDFIYEIVAAGHTREELESGTGRSLLWEAYIEGWKMSPIIGHGFIVGEKGAAAASYIAFATNTSHNMMISVLVNTGLIGMAFWLWFLWKSSFTCYKISQKMNPYARACLPALIGMFVNANSFPVIGSEWSPMSPPIYALLIFIFVYIPLSDRIGEFRHR